MVHEEFPVLEFNAGDRCDGCGAQAHALAQCELGELMFCIHHLRKNRARLLDEGWEVIEDWESIDSLYNPDPEYYPIPV